MNTLLFISFIGLIVIAYYIYTYKQIYNNNTLLNDKPNANLESNQSFGRGNSKGSIERKGSKDDSKKRKGSIDNSKKISESDV